MTAEMLASLQKNPIPMSPSVQLATTLEAVERSFMWLADLVLRIGTEVGALPEGYAVEAQKVQLAFEYFKVAAVYDAVELWRRQQGALVVPKPGIVTP